MITREFQPGRFADYTPIVRAALAGVGPLLLRFAPGRYDFHPERAHEELVFAPGHDPGPRRVAFPLIERTTLAIHATGAQFVFHGRLLPFLLRDTANVVLEGFSVDHRKAFHSEARVISSDGSSITLEFAESPQREAWMMALSTPNASSRLVVLDLRREDPALGWGDERLPSVQWEPIGATQLRVLRWPRETPPAPGQAIALINGRRELPSIYIRGGQNLELRDVTIHQAEGTGLLAHACKDLRVTGCRVSPRPGSGIHLSTLGEAIACIHCRGLVEIEGCSIENTGSSGIAVYSLGLVFASAGSAQALEGRCPFRQYHGAHLASAGDTVEMRDRESLAAYGSSRIVAAARLNSEFLRLQTAPALTHAPRLGDLIEFPDAKPTVHVRKCFLRGSAGNGLEIYSAHQATIEACTFHTPGAALSLTADPFRAGRCGTVPHLAFEHNKVLSCAYGKWGRAAIQACPEIPFEHRASTRWHKSLRIAHNTFQIFDPRLLAAYCIEDIGFCENRITLTSDIPLQNPSAAAFSVDFCDQVRIQNNQLDLPEDSELEDFARELVESAPSALQLISSL